jgi:hypothetical protein
MREKRAVLTGEIFMLEKIGKWLDTAGVPAFWACAVHCLALPF